MTICRFRFTSLLACIFLVIGLLGCKTKQNIDTEHPNIVAFTSGTISILSPIRIVLTDDALKLAPNVGMPVEETVFQFSPKVPGTAYWLDENLIEFRPDNPFEAGKEYTIKFLISKIVNVGNAPKTFTFQVNTINPTFYYQIDGLSLYNKQANNLYYLTGTVKASDFIPADKVSELLDVSDSNGNSLYVKWDHNYSENSHSFRIDSIKAEKTPYNLTLQWNGKSIGYDFESEKIIRIPGANEFSLIEVQVIQSPEQYIQCTFSEPIDDKQKLSNYISLDNDATLRFTVNLNTINIYLASRETGTYNLTIEKGLKTTSGKTLEETVVKELVFEELKPTVKFLSSGVILPNSNGLHLPFQAVNYGAVNVEITQIYENNILQFLQTNSLDGDDELYRVGKTVFSKLINLSEEKAVNLRTWNTFSLDLSKLIEPEPGAIYRVELYGRSPLIEEQYEYYYDSYRNRTRNVLATDIGLTAKLGDDNEIHTSVANLVTTQPMSGVTLTAYNFLNQLIGESVTDKDGMGIIKCSETPHVIIAQQGKQKSYMRVGEGLSLSLSSFDVSGTSVQQGLKGYIYGERGVWRPGDTLHISFMLEDRHQTLPANHPVNFELRDPNGDLINKQVKTSSSNGLYYFPVKTNDDALTGMWEARIKVGNEYFTKSLRIETVKPNRLKIDFKLDNDPVSSEGLKGNLSVHWLHGAVARNLPVQVNARISSTKTTFKDYKDYVFDDPLKSFDTEEETLIDTHINDQGELSVNAPINVSDDAPGMLRLFLSTRVSEEGGDFSIDEFTTNYSPYSSYTGIRQPEGEGYDNMLQTDTDQPFQIVTIDETGKPVSRKNVKIDIFKVEWSWWWYSSYGSGLASYSKSKFETPIYSGSVSTTNGKGTFSYKWQKYGWGLYLLRVTDPVSGHSSGIVSYVDYGYGGRSKSGDGSGAAMLVFKTDKPKYNVGEQAVITFPSATGSRALVSIEAGTSILKAFWIECTDKETRFDIPTTTDMVPNVYVHISLIQPHAQTVNDAPIRMYGVVPLLVEDPNTHLKPVIQMPDVLKPEESFKISVSEQNKQTMSYTLAIVDDGLLDLTRFKTPDPWSSFFAKEALGIKTWDLYDMVIGAYGGKIAQLFAVGGDDELSADDQANSKAKRFKPVVRFIGPFTLEKGKTNEHKITLPPYVGSVRTMVVAANEHGYGSSEKTSAVRKPLMTLATLPRVVGPGEEVWLPVSVFAMEDNIKNVNVEVKTGDIFQVDDDKKKSISFSTTGDQTVYFKLKVKDYTGVGWVNVIATSGNEKAEHRIEIDIRNPNPRLYTFTDAIVEAGKKWDGNYTLPGMPGTNQVTLEASYIPPLNLGQRLSYLINYPHGCIEQTTSSAFPQLFLSDVMDLAPGSKQTIEINMKAALNRLRSFITPEGGFGYWPGNTTPSSWGSSYAGHFMLEAEAKGYILPQGMKDSWLKYQKNRARNWRTNEGNDLEQAYRLYTLALANDADLSAMNRLKEYVSMSVQARWRLAATYALAGKPEIAKSLTDNLETSITPYSRFSETFGTAERDLAMILETLTLTKSKTAAFAMVKKISDALNSNQWMGTQTTAYCLLAISKYAAGEKGTQEINIEYNDGGTKEAKSSMPTWQTKLDIGNKTGTGSVKLTNKSKVPLYVRITAEGIPAPGNEKSAESQLKIEVKFIDSKGNQIDVSKLEQGVDFKAVVTVFNPGQSGHYTNMILSEIFPSGWEIINTRLNDEDDSSSSNAYDYIDIRDDRVYTYFSLNPNTRKTFTVSLASAYRGKFYLPAFSCEAMYDATINANNEGRWIEVTSRQ